MPSDTSAIFITGNSRSGTTMMSRILGNHDDVFTFQELHFFDELAGNREIYRQINSKSAAKLYAKLIAVSRRGYFGNRDTNEFIEEAEEMINGSESYSPFKIYKLFLENEPNLNGKKIACEHTPQNIFYLNDLLNSFPASKSIIMVRDPRAVLLSQKNKWKRRNLSGGAIPFRESVRSRINYHPVTISKIWNTVMKESENYTNNNKVIFIKYESLISDTESTIRKVCEFLHIEFHNTMLEIPVVGSSNFMDSGNVKGIDPSKTEQWKNGGLNSAEIQICQNINSDLMDKYSYKKEQQGTKYILKLYYMIILPFQLVLSVLFNLKRLKKPFALLKKLTGN